MSGAYPYMLDTNAASTLIRGRADSALQKLLLEHGTCVSVITEAELRFGVTRRPEATRLATAVAVFLQDTPVLPWTSTTAHAYAELRTRMESRGVSLSAMDLLIAAHAQAEDCTLVSADRAFTQVPGLRVFDWSVDSTSVVRAKPARAGITARDIEAARVHARTPVRQTTPKTKAKKKPNKKLKAK
jgi:tRNA(fMet)-specific endonuclease VapC